MPMFRSAPQLERQIGEFFDAIAQGAIVFRDGIDDYLDGRERDFAAKLTAIDTLESTADHLSREVEAQLYRRSLIPEHRGDVLGLLEHTDDVIDHAKTCLRRFDVERPVVPAPLAGEFRRLTGSVYQAADALLLAARLSFRDPAAVSDHLIKVYHFEGEADRIGLELRRAIFASALDLAHKLQLRYFVESVDIVADTAEHVAGRLAIYAIKRQL
jgi:uncharacterized protein